MTLVGKIFIVLILFMSVMFMAFAVSVYSTHINWKERVATVQQQVNTTRQDKDRLAAEVESQKTSLSFERAARREALVNLEQRAQEKTQLLEAKERQYQDLLAQQRNAIQSVENAQRQSDQLQAQVTDLRQQILDAQQDRDAQFATVRKLTDQLHEAESIRANLERRRQKLEEDLAMSTNVLKVNGLSKDSDVTGIPPKLYGQVRSVGNDLIEITIGKDDGLQPGHTVEVSRQDRYLGRGVVTRVSYDSAVARLLTEYKKAPIREGDSVQTKVR